MLKRHLFTKVDLKREVRTLSNRFSCFHFQNFVTVLGKSGLKMKAAIAGKKSSYLNDHNADHMSATLKLTYCK